MGPTFRAIRLVWARLSPRRPWIRRKPDASSGLPVSSAGFARLADRPPATFDPCELTDRTHTSAPDRCRWRVGWSRSRAYLSARGCCREPPTEDRPLRFPAASRQDADAETAT